MEVIISRVIATFFYSGYSPLFPGTVASALTALLFFYLPPLSPIAMSVLLSALLLLGVIVSSVIESNDGQKDPSYIVIDEVVGMGIALLLVPHTIRAYALAFVCFRLLDILKPFPINRAQDLPDGWGVMMDDVIAGFLALSLAKIILHVFF